MFLRALLAFLLLPGLVGLALPPLLAHLDPWAGGVQWWGGSLMAAGAIILLWCVRDFYVSGKGTLAPWSPPRIMVVTGLYRHCRNPMYVGVLTLVAGWSVLLCSPLLALYALLLAIGFHMRVRRYEEPWLQARFPGEWTLYRAAVPRWLPRLTPFTMTFDDH